MKALILCGGFGTRLKEVIHDRPKVMAPVGDKPFLEYVIGNLHKSGVDDLVISIGYLGGYIRDYFGDGQNFNVKITYSEEFRPLGTGGAVKLAEKNFNEPYFVVNGDTYIEADFIKLLEFHTQKHAKITIAAVRKSVSDQAGYVKVDRHGRVISFLEKPKAKKMGLVSCGIYVFEPKALAGFKNNYKFSLESDFFPKTARSGKMYVYDIKEDFLDIGTGLRYQRAINKLSKTKERIVEVRVPARISFAGGGTDLPDYFFKFGGCVVGGSIDKYAHCQLKSGDFSKIKIKLPDFGRTETYSVGQILKYDSDLFNIYRAAINKLKPKTGFEATIWGDFSPGSGLGTSSACLEAIIFGLSISLGEKIDGQQLAKLAIEIEREDLKIAGGWQDQYHCASGNLKFIEFKKNGEVQVEYLKISQHRVRKLEDNLLLCNIGGVRSEKVQQKHLLKNINQSTQAIDALLSLKKVVLKMREAIEAGSLDRFGRLLNDAWELKRQSSNKITTGKIDEVYEYALENGALGGKLLGAGGGGYLLLYVPQSSRRNLVTRLNKKKIEIENVVFDLTGPTIITDED